MAGEVERLLRAYERHVQVPWDDRIAGPERVWFAIYDKTQERRLRARIKAFENATEAAGYWWHYVDVTDTFAEWMASHRYREAYFKEPELLESALDGYTRYVIDRIKEELQAPDVDSRTVVAVLGVGSFFGLTYVSRVVDGVAHDIHGRLLVFFPGVYEKQNYRLLDARDGFNYLAVPITAS